MKRLLKIFVLAMTLVVTASCSAQYRAQRHMRRAIELCPELAQIRTRSIDTLLVVPGYQDIARVPMENVFQYDTLYLDTDHGTISLSFDQADSTITVGYTADPAEIHYHDTISYTEVIVPPDQDGNAFWKKILTWILGVGAGMALTLWLLRYATKK